MKVDDFFFGMRDEHYGDAFFPFPDENDPVFFQCRGKIAEPRAEQSGNILLQIVEIRIFERV